MQNSKDNIKAAEQIFIAGIDGVKPSVLIKKHISADGKGICVKNTLFPFLAGQKIFVIGAGKASGAMAEAIEEILGDKITGGHVIVKYGYSRPLKKINITEAGHPVPDHNGFVATQEIIKIAEEACENDIVICLISGGGSALLADCPPGIDEKDMIEMHKLLVRCGASIFEINTIRKHISSIKGGKLARLVWPAILINLIISDVPGDDPAVIASGPSYPDNTTFSDALDIIKKYHLETTMPEALLVHLKKGAEGILPENPRSDDKIFGKTHNIIIGNNRIALEAAASKAAELGFDYIIDDNTLTGDVYSASEYIVNRAVEAKKIKKSQRPLCLLFGGETTVEVKRGGTGGRNQYLALLCARHIRKHRGITILCGGTDGTDGPTDAAGAVIDSGTWTDAIMNRIDPQIYIDNFDSFNFFREAGGHVITGPTLTNVMDIIVLLV